MKPPPLVSLITVNFNQTDATCALLDSIRRQDYRNVEVIVVDNGSRDDPAAIFESNYPEVQFIRSEQNLGFAGGNNLALPQAKGDYLFFVNNDAELVEGCIGQLLALFEQVPGLGIASPLICYFPEKMVEGRRWKVEGLEINAGPPPSTLHPPPSTVLIQYAGMTRVNPFTGRNRTVGNKESDTGQFAEPRPTAYAHGAAMMIPRRVLERVGPMEEGFFLYYEELDWCERIRRAGFSVWVEPRARVYHKESLTVQKLGALKTYYLNRNRVWFMRRNYGGWRLGVFYTFLFLVTIPKNVLLFLLRGEMGNLKAFLQGILWNFGSKFSK
ncbi:MAG TPA: glycosyltransferase family 2 protein [Saprospiraceae bacterium]|nr:glycosyltransferase family 2 protein [Saprospiraceae bacterium]